MADIFISYARADREQIEAQMAANDGKLVAISLDGGAPATGPPATAKALVGNPIKLDDKGPRIAVVPIKVRGNDADLPDLAEDLAESIASGLSRFPWLNVTTQASVNEARANVERWKTVWPGSLEDYRLNLKRWFYPQPELLKRLEDDLRTAGMEFFVNTGASAQPGQAGA